MSAEKKSVQVEPEITVEEPPQTEPVIEPEPESKQKAPVVEKSAPAEPVRVQEPVKADDIEKKIAPNNYEQVQQVMGEPAQEKKS